MSDAEIDEGRGRHAAAGLLFSLLILTLAIVGVVAFARWQSRGVTVQATFGDARGLQGGERVVLSGVPIGEVTKVQLVREGEIVVTMRLDDAHADKVRGGFTALISSATFPNVSGTKQVELFNPADPEAPLVEEGAIVEGQDTIVGVKAWQVKEKLRSTGGNASDAARGIAEKLAIMTEELMDIPESPEVQAAVDRLAQLAEDLKLQSQEGMEQLRAHWEEMKTEFDPVMEEWKERGKEKGLAAWLAALELWQEKSQALREQYGAWREERGAPAPPEETPAPTEATP